MARFIGFLLVLALIGFVVYRFVITSADQRSCERLASLCGEKSETVERCVNHVKGLGKMNGEAAAKFHSCVGDAHSCGEAAGCVVGAGFGAVGQTLNDFIKGLGKALDKK